MNESSTTNSGPADDAPTGLTTGEQPVIGQQVRDQLVRDQLVRDQPVIDGMTPKEIVSELDKYIIGQAKAKRAVAVALRNRSRRRALAGALREEVQPKNIIMIGSTGVGKTEIARRLAKLAHAPFIKVEATKYTEVGYVGRDVESMVRDLVNIAIKMGKKEMRRKVQAKAEANAENRILSALLPKSDNPPGTSRLADAMEAERAKKTEETKEAFRKKLQKGDLDDREVEIEQSQSSTPMMHIMSPGGMEDMEMNIQNMLGDLMPKRTRKRKVRIDEARKIFLEEEIEKLLDMEKIQRQAISKVEEMGIIFLDEIDKITTRSGQFSSGEVSREGVQRDLLPIVEGATVNTKFGPVQTDHILFIAAGAFHGSKVSDLIPELQGRFPIRVELDKLTEEDFKAILTQPTNALTKQYEALLSTEGLTVEFTEDGIDELSKIATKVNMELENIGARRLHTILERVFEEISFDAPELADKSPKVVINQAFVSERLGDVLTSEDLSKFIL